MGWQILACAAASCDESPIDAADELHDDSTSAASGVVQLAAACSIQNQNYVWRVIVTCAHSHNCSHRSMAE